LISLIVVGRSSVMVVTPLVTLWTYLSVIVLGICMQGPIRLQVCLVVSVGLFGVGILMWYVGCYALC
jgi:hypothetical protein